MSMIHGSTVMDESFSPTIAVLQVLVLIGKNGKTASKEHLLARSSTEPSPTIPCPVGPIERTIEYVAPFDRCDREKDYEIAWKFFEQKYKEE